MRKLVALFAVLGACLATAFLVANPVGYAYTKRMLSWIGVGKLERPDLGFTPNVFLNGKPVAWIDVDRTGGGRVGDGPSGNWSIEYKSGGIVGMADGTCLGFSHLTLRGDGVKTTVVP
jgi:hypothetical protein